VQVPDPRSATSGAPGGLPPASAEFLKESATAVEGLKKLAARAMTPFLKEPIKTRMRATQGSAPAFGSGLLRTLLSGKSERWVRGSID
jgi:hypothetical protein